ncbi:Cytochrome c oxidase assembly protein COX19 [Trichinella sp. T9]|nr:Cytochrome c oxidase assembly protein COX19 [Trichinella sp. T9]
MSGPFKKSVIQREVPLKGSFPLDHEGVCKLPMLDYMLCLQKNDQNNQKCRIEAKNYFECRMKNNLMMKEDWKMLGFHDTKSNNDDKKCSKE